jgi:iron complex transport system substrate-binding protein
MTISVSSRAENPVVTINNQFLTDTRLTSGLLVAGPPEVAREMAIIDSAMRIHNELGPGLLESVCELYLRLIFPGKAGWWNRQKAVPSEFDGLQFDEGLRIGLLVGGRVVVELKSVEKIAPVHGKQLLTDLHLMNLPVGLLINFGGATLKEGLQRVVNHLTPFASPRLRVNH